MYIQNSLSRSFCIFVHGPFCELYTGHHSDQRVWDSAKFSIENYTAKEPDILFHFLISVRLNIAPFCNSCWKSGNRTLDR